MMFGSAGPGSLAQCVKIDHESRLTDQRQLSILRATALMAELVDAADSKSVFERSGSSSLPRGTKIRKKPTLWSVFFRLNFDLSYRSQLARPLWKERLRSISLTMSSGTSAFVSTILESFQFPKRRQRGRPKAPCQFDAASMTSRPPAMHEAYWPRYALALNLSLVGYIPKVLSA